MRLTATLEAARRKGGYCHRIQFLMGKIGRDWPEDRPVDLLDTVLPLLGADDCVWVFQAAKPKPEADRVARLVAADSAAAVSWLWENRFPHDHRPFGAIAAAWAVGEGRATEDSLTEPRGEAWQAILECRIDRWDDSPAILAARSAFWAAAPSASAAAIEGCWCACQADPQFEEDRLDEIVRRRLQEAANGSLPPVQEADERRVTV